MKNKKKTSREDEKKERRKKEIETGRGREGGEGDVKGEKEVRRTCVRADVRAQNQAEVLT